MTDSQGLNPKDIVGAKKAPLGFVPPALYIGAAEGMAIGADKYGPFNWRGHLPIQYMTYVEAMLRHLLALVDGQDLAEDTGVHHLKHVLAGGGILLDAIESGRVVDNRPIKGPAADMLRAQDKSVARPTDEEIVTKLLEDSGWDPVLPGDSVYIGCDPTECEDPDCGVHDPSLGCL